MKIEQKPISSCANPVCPNKIANELKVGDISLSVKMKSGADKEGGVGFYCSGTTTICGIILKKNCYQTLVKSGFISNNS